MALIPKAGVPSLSSVLPPQSSSIVGLVAGEAIAAGDVCYINANGTVMRSDGTAANAAAVARGIAFQAAVTGDAVTLYRNVNVRYGAGLTPGAPVYVTTAALGAGGLDDAPTVGGTDPIGFVVDATRIHIVGQ
jgi:hypothetical protein